VNLGEIPAAADGFTTVLASLTRPAQPLTSTVDGLRPGVPYRPWRYDSLAAIPQSDFNAQAHKAARPWTLSDTSGSSTTLITITVQSDQVAAHRAVPLSARWAARREQAKRGTNLLIKNLFIPRIEGGADHRVAANRTTSPTGLPPLSKSLMSLSSMNI
jgi:hypothetical protein